MTGPVELSIVMPCLNEAETLGACIAKAQAVLRDHAICGEIVIADNCSRDGSQAVAEAMCARVVRVSDPGYGRALLAGITAARGRYVAIGDADGSYDFAVVPLFLAKLREGYDLVQGCRLPRGGGRMLPGAMPALHRRVGNPLFSWMARRWFAAPVNDVYCGLRALSKHHFERLEQSCGGMEFAAEMIVKSSLVGARIAELPITLYPDGRTLHRGHLRTIRDGWRTLRYLVSARRQRRLASR